MSNFNILLRIENDNIYSSKTLESLVEYDELLCFKTEVFEKPEDVFQRAREVLAILKEKESLQEVKICSSHFAYLFAKFDSIYNEALMRRNTLSEQGEQERELRQLLRELIKCEQLTHRYVERPTEYPRVLVSLLEVFFDDYENLDALILLLFHKFFNAGERDLNIIGPLHSKTLYFMSPFLKFFYQKNFDLVEFYCKKDFETIEQKIDSICGEIDAILQKHIESGEEISKNLLHYIKQNGGNIPQAQKKLIYEKKDEFTEEDRYYEVLGNLSLIQYLWCLNQKDPKISSAFLRIGVTSYLFTLNDLTTKSATNISYRLKYFRAINNVELRSNPKFLSRSLQFILTEMKENKTEELIQLVELNTCVISCLVNFLNQRMYAELFKGTLEEYIDSFILPDNAEDFAWNNLMRFVRANFEEFSQRSSCYVAKMTIGENILDTWAELVCKIQNATFLFEPDEDYVVKQTYFPSILKITQSIQSLIIDGKFIELPQFLQEKLILATSWYQNPDRAFITESDLFSLYDIGQKSMLKFLQGLLEGSETSKELQFAPIFEIIYKHLKLLLFSGEQNFAIAHKLFKLVYSSELILEIVKIYNEGQERGLRDILTSKDAMGPFLSFAIFLLRLISENQSFLDEANLAFLERFLEDLMNMDQSLISEKDYIQILSLIETMLSNAQLLKQEKTKLQLLFTFSRFYMAKVPFQSALDYSVLKGIFTVFLSESSNRESALLFLVETLVEIYETKMKNPSLDLKILFAEKNDKIKKKEDELNKVTIAEGQEEGNIERMERNNEIQSEELMKISGEKRFQELKRISCGFCRKVTAMVFSAAKAILPQLEPFKEQTTSLIKQTVKMGFSPLFMFSSSWLTIQKFQIFSRDIITSNDEYLEAYLEGFFEGIIEICEFYKLHESETMSQIRIFEVYQILVQNSKLSWTKDQDTLKGLTYTEAALVSLPMILDACTEIFDRVYMIPEALDLKLRESIMKATSFILQISTNFHKEIAQWIVSQCSEENKDQVNFWKELSKRYKKFTKANVQISTNLGTIYSICLKQDGLKKAIKSVYESFWVNFEQESFKGEDKKFKLIYHCLMMKEFMESLPDNYDAKRSLINSIVINPRNLERILEASSTVIDVTVEYYQEMDEEVLNVWLEQILNVLQSIDVEMNREEVQKVCFGQEENSKKIFELIRKAIENLNREKMVNKNSKSIKSCLVELFMLFDLIHRLYFEYVENHIETLNPEKKESMIEDLEAALNDLEAAIDDLESDDDEDEGGVVEETSSSVCDNEEVEPERSESLSNEEYENKKNELIEEFKKELKYYVETSLPYRLYVLDDIEEILSLADEYEAVSHDFWIQRYTQIYKSTLEFFVQQVSKTDIGEKLLGEVNQLEGDLSDILQVSMAPSDGLNKICQLDLLFGHLTQFFVPAISDSLPLSINFIEGLVETVIILFQELASEDLSQHKKDLKLINFPEITNRLVNAASNTMIDFVVSQVSKHQGDDDVFQRILGKMLDMLETIFSVHQKMLDTLKWDFFDQNEDYFAGIVNLMNVILRANKSLHMRFLNKNLLRTLLTIQRVHPMNSDQSYSLMDQISTLLENCYKKVHGTLIENFDDKINKLQKEVSPVAQRCMQDILEALLENYKFEDVSLHLHKEAKKRSEFKKQARQEIKFTFREPYEIPPQVDETADKGLEEEVYYGESFKRRIAIKETLSLVMLFAAITFNYPDFSPYILFEDAESYRESLGLLTGRKFSRKPISIMDVLLSVLLCKNEDAVIFLVSSLVDSRNKNTKIRDLFIRRILEIMADLMDSEREENEVLGSFESMLLRRNIGLIIIYLSNVVNHLENLTFEKKESVQELILNVTEKLLESPAIIAYSAENSSRDSSLLFIIKKIFEENKCKGVDSEEVKKPYSDVLKAIELEVGREKQQNNFGENSFEQYIFKTDIENNDQHQRDFESQKEEIDKFCQLASLGEEWKNLVDPIKLPIDPKTNFAQDFILKLSSHIDNSVDFYKALPSQNKVVGVDYDYFRERMISNAGFLQGYKASKDQTFNNSENFAYLPGLLRAKTGTIKDIEMSDDEEEKEEKDSKKESDEIEPEEDDDENQNDDGMDEECEIQYLLDKDIKSEESFKDRFNKAVGKAKVLREIICVEEVLHKSEDFSARIQEIIMGYVEGMPDFEKNVVYLGLDNHLKNYLRPELQEKIQNIKKELKMIKENFSLYEKARGPLIGENGSAEEVEEHSKDDQKQEEDVEEANSEGQKDDDIEDHGDGEDEGVSSEGGSDKEEAAPKYEELDFEMLKLKKNENACEEIENKGKFALKSINHLKMSDKSILEACKLLFVRYSFEREASKLVESFLKDLICCNPANEIRLFDTLLFILYSPECLQESSLEDEFEFKPVRVITEGCSDHCTSLYEITVTSILTFLVDYFEDNEKSHIFFIPMGSLNHLGNQKLNRLKAKTHYMDKISECQSFLDGIIGLIKTQAFSEKKIWITTILTGLEKILQREKSIKIGHIKSNIENYEKIISSDKIINLLNEKDEEVIMRVQDIFYHLKDVPEIFIQLKDDLLDYFLMTLDEVLADMKLENPNIKVIQIILLTFVSVFYANIFVKQKKEEVSLVLRDIAFSLFSQEKVKRFFTNIYEMLDLNHKEAKAIQNSEKVDLLILICLYQFSIIIMANTCDLGQGNESLLASYEEEQERASVSEEHNEHQKIFESFVEKYTKSICRLTSAQISKKENQALGDALSIIIPEIPWIVDFEAKSKLLRYKIERHLENEGIEGANIQTTEIFVDRKNLLSSTMKLFKDYDLIALLRHLEVNFQGESGVDGGGLRREFYELLIKELFNPLTGLFVLSDNKIAVQPNPFSGIIPNHLVYFQFAGIILAKAISDRIVVDLTLTKAFLKHILGRKLTLNDLEDLDEKLGKNMQWILINNVDDLFLTQTHEMEFLGERITFELTEKGSEITLDNGSKKDYVRNLCEQRLSKLIQKQLEAFLQGFHAMLPKHLISYLSPSELEVMIAGSPKIDLQEMKEHAILCNYNENNKVVGWFWEVLEEFDQNKLAAFYYFISGSVKVPIGGFKQNFIRIKRNNTKNGLPISHTCIYEIEIPEYDSKEVLRERLLTAIFDGIDGFHIT